MCIRDRLESMASHAGLIPSNTSVKDAADKWVSYARNWLEPRPGAIKTLETIVSKGTKVGLLSNCSDEVVTVWSETPFLRYFTEVTFSCEVRVMKPDPEIYHGACRRLEVLPKNCLFVGDGQHKNSYVKELQNKMKKLGMINNFRFLGNQTDMPAVYKMADVVVSASTKPEAFGRVVAESMAMGRPTVAVNHGGGAEIIKDNNSNLLFPQ